MNTRRCDVYITVQGISSYLKTIQCYLCITFCVHHLYQIAVLQIKQVRPRSNKQ